MSSTYAYEGKINKAFSMLLMAQATLDNVVPDSDDEQARAIAAEFVAKLIKAAVDNLMPSANDDLLARPAAVVKMDDPQSFLDCGVIIDTVDIDRQIGRYLISASAG